VAKSPFRTATCAVPVLHGSSARPLLVTAAGMPRRRRGGPGPGHGRPVPAARLTYPYARYADEDDDGCSRQPVSRVGGQDPSWHVTVPSATLLLLLL
jgi:hypothetical protein